MPTPPDPKKAILLATISLTTIRSLKDAMNDNEKALTGLTNLTNEQWTNLDTWLSNNAVLSPGQGNE